MTRREEVIIHELLYDVIQSLNPPPNDEEDGESDGSSSSSEEAQVIQRRKRYNWDVVCSHLRSEREIAHDLTPAGALPHGLCGLQNIGNTCYMNAALQCLSNTQPLRRVFLGPPGLLHSTSRSAPIKALTDDYTHLVWDMWSGAHRYVAPQRLHYHLGFINPLFRGRAQHDSQEFLRTLLDSLHESLKRNDYSSLVTKASSSSSDSASSTAATDANNSAKSQSKPNPIVPTESSISTLFEGQLLSTVVCGNCGRASETKDRFFDLSLSIPSEALSYKIMQRRSLLQQLKRGREEDEEDDGGDGDEQQLLDFAPEAGFSSSAAASPGVFGRFFGRISNWIWTKSETDLESCLHGFCVPDELRGQDQYRCEHCKKLHDATKAFTIASPPHILCLHIKRFKYDFFGSKVSDYVKFPLENLDLSDFCSRGGARHSTSSPLSSLSSSHAPNDTRQRTNGHHPTSNGTTPSSYSKPPLYNLHAVICHSGSLHGGHYYAYAKNAATGTWYEFNDSMVAEVDEVTVEQAEAYVLFYEQQTPASITESREELKFQIRTYLEEQKRLEEEDPSKVLTADTPYVSLTWLTKWLLLNNPGPINAPALMCSHNHALRVNVIHLVPLPRSVADHFVKAYGGELFYMPSEPCPLCEHDRLEQERKEEEAKARLEQIKARRDEESNQVTELGKLLKDPQEVRKGYYFVEINWVMKWLDFVRGESDDIPGPIDNTALLKGPVPKNGYRALNDSVWKYLFKIYGGGPEVWAKTSKFPQTPTSKAQSNDRSDSDSEAEEY